MSGEAHGTYWATPWLAAYYAEDEIDGSGDPDTEIGFVAIQIVEGGSLRCFPGSFRCVAQMSYGAGRRGHLRRYGRWRRLGLNEKMEGSQIGRASGRERGSQCV